MITLTVTNRQVTIDGAPRSIIRALEQVTSYRVAGFMFAPSFKRGFWDGKEHLLTHSDKHGYQVPAGLLEDVTNELTKLEFDYKIVNKRRLHSERIAYRWNTDIKPRLYQKEAIRSITKDLIGQTLFGNGILKMAIRSGKTKTAAKVIHILGCRTVFIVPSIMLLYQTKAVLSHAFPDEYIGQIGDGQWDVGDITVSTIQTLTQARGRRKDGDKPKVPRRPEYTELIQTTDFAVFDEAHHITGQGEWHKTFHDFDAMFKMGLSATAYLDNASEQERGIIWLKATCGPMRIDIGMSRLVDEGWLMKQNVRIFTINQPNNLKDMKWSQTLRDKAIISNKHRNNKIAAIAQNMARKMKVLIVCNRLDQIKHISEMLWDRGVEHHIIVGPTKRATRNEYMDEFTNGDVNVIIGTVLSEGIDIPEAEVVINAEGGKDVKGTIQRMRNMTISEGKNLALLIDFWDTMNPYFLKHSKARLETYRSEESFDVEMVA